MKYKKAPYMGCILRFFFQAKILTAIPGRSVPILWKIFFEEFELGVATCWYFWKTLNI